MAALYSEPASDQVEGTGDSLPEIDEMTLAELRALAKKKGLAGYSAMSKDELTAFIEQEG